MPGARTQGCSGRARVVACFGAIVAAEPTQALALPAWDPSAPAAEVEEPATETAESTVEPAPEQPAPVANVTSANDHSAAAPVQPPRRVAGDELPPVPIDPNDAPFMRAPNNQLETRPPRTRPDIRQGWSARRRIALTVAPAFASLRLPFLYRPKDSRIHGAGVNVEFDVQAWRWIWVRALGIYSGHPVDEERVEQNMEVTRTAPPGTIHVIGYGLGPVFALDLGRWLPLIEVGVAGLQIVTPKGGIQGQRGEACLGDGGCDVGLKCNSARVCEVRTVGEMYLGLAVDVLVRRHLSFGAQFRYNVRFTELKAFNLTPGYLVGTVRLSVRF